MSSKRRTLVECKRRKKQKCESHEYRCAARERKGGIWQWCCCFRKSDKIALLLANIHNDKRTDDLEYEKNLLNRFLPVIHYVHSFCAGKKNYRCTKRKR